MNTQIHIPSESAVYFLVYFLWNGDYQVTPKAMFILSDMILVKD